MSRKKKIMLVFFIIISTLVLVCTGIYIADSLKPHYECYETKWEINFPEGVKEEFYTDTGESFRGDGLKYSVLIVCKENAEEFVKDFNKEDKENLKQLFMQRVHKLGVPDEQYPEYDFQPLDVPAEQYPEFTHEYTWKQLFNEDDGRDTLIMIYDEQVGKIYVLQDNV